MDFSSPLSANCTRPVPRQWVSARLATSPLMWDWSIAKAIRNWLGTAVMKLSVPLFWRQNLSRNQNEIQTWRIGGLLQESVTKKGVYWWLGGIVRVFSETPHGLPPIATATSEWVSVGYTIISIRICKWNNNHIVINTSKCICNANINVCKIHRHACTLQLALWSNVKERCTENRHPKSMTSSDQDRISLKSK